MIVLVVGDEAVCKDLIIWGGNKQFAYFCGLSEADPKRLMQQGTKEVMRHPVMLI